MKASVKDIRELVKEEFMRGVPEFVLQQAVDDCVIRIRDHVKKFIATRAENPTHSRELQAIADEALEELDEEMYALIEDKLWSFLQQTLLAEQVFLRALPSEDAETLLELSV